MPSINVAHSPDGYVVISAATDQGKTVAVPLTPGEAMQLVQLLGTAVDLCLAKPATVIQLPSRIRS